MFRRRFIQSLPLIPAMAAARTRHIHLAISAGVYSAHPIAEAARRIKQAGFEGAQLSMRFADARFNPAGSDWDFARRARDAFGEAGLRMIALDGYTNLVDPDPAARRRNVQGLARLLEHAREFGTNIVATESGTFHPDQARHPQPDDAAEGWKIFLASLREAVKAAESSGATLAMEGSAATYLATVEMVRRMLDEVGSPHLKVLWDAANYFDEAHIGQIPAGLKNMAAACGRDIVLAHGKDVRLKPDGKVEWLTAGKGVLDYAVFTSLLDKLGREIFLALEYLKEPEVPQVKAYVEKYLRA